MENMKKIIIDTDIGDDIDDAYALAVAVRMGCFDILGVTTVYRNSLQRAKIASALLRAMDRGDIGVYVGNDYPYRETFCIEPFEEALPDGRPVIPHYSEAFGKMPVCGQAAAEFIAEQAEKYPNEVVVVAIGPLTNLADVARKYPASYAKIAEIVCMGGSFSKERAEWNIRCDPEAAETVLRGGVPIRFVGIDVTAYTYLDEADIGEFLSEKDEAFSLLGVMLRKWMDTHPGRKPTMHDVLTVAEVNGGFCSYAQGGLEIPLQGPYRAYTFLSGRTGAPVVTYAVDLNRTAFIDFFKDTLFRTSNDQGGKR